MLSIHPIQARDNQALAALIRLVMGEFNADPASTILGDPSLDNMFEYYQADRAFYYVAFLDEQLIGGCGIKALDGSTENICELQRLFLHPATRGQGIGKQLLELCLQKATEFGYTEIYLETLEEMQAARTLYQHYGFHKICYPKGNTGHCGCDVWMMRSLQAAAPPIAEAF